MLLVTNLPSSYGGASAKALAVNYDYQTYNTILPSPPITV